MQDTVSYTSIEMDLDLSKVAWRSVQNDHSLKDKQIVFLKIESCDKLCSRQLKDRNTDVGCFIEFRPTLVWETLPLESQRAVTLVDYSMRVIIGADKSEGLGKDTKRLHEDYFSTSTKVSDKKVYKKVKLHTCNHRTMHRG